MDENDVAEPETEQRTRRSLRSRLFRFIALGTFLVFIGWNAAILVNINEDPLPDKKPDGATAADGAPAPSPTAGPAPTEGHDPRTVTVAAVGDIGMQSTGRATLEEMAKANPDVYLALGDLSYAGPTSENKWCNTVRSIVGPVAPVQLVAGNHEEDTREDGHITEFAECLPDRLNAVGTYGEQYYFDLGKLARFILISPDLTINGAHYFYGDANANLKWVQSAIDTARTSGIKWVVVGMHKNCISVGEYYCNVYQDLFSALIRNRVDLVLHGHEHNYQRSKQLANRAKACPTVLLDTADPDCIADDGSDHNYEKGAGTVFLISGAGGGSLYDVNHDDPEAPYFAATMGKNQTPRHGFVLLTITPSTLSARFVGSSPGEFEDQFDITAKPGS